MRKSIVAKPKKRGPGRPRTGRTPMMGLRGTPAFRAEIEAWAESQEDTPKLSEAIRRLVELGLKAQTATKATRSTPNKVRAAELAANAIEKVIDPAAAPEERARRRRRLTKGPLEFREDRVDLPKAKK